MESRIQVLPPAVAERIAAGEVIERPASVVKELVENSLDAGASEVCVTLEDGGKALIEVMDNGSGMTPEELAIAPLRHATSKLRTLEDLEKIHTLGFRGEALPSVAAVAELSILSLREGGSEPHELLAGEPGGRGMRVQPVSFGHFLGKEHGTRIQARGLFSQVPARLKFLKAASSEVREVREWMERLALTHPAVRFRLLSEDRTVLDLRPGSEPERVAQVLADSGDYPVVSAESEAPGLRLRAHWVQGLAQGQMRKLLQIVNHRAVRDRVLQQAILQPFRQAMLPGQFPAVALFIDADPALLDVNVHPTKAEVRFLDSGRVFRAVSKLLEELVSRYGAPAHAAGASAGSRWGQPSTGPAWAGAGGGYSLQAQQGLGQAPGDRWQPPTPAWRPLSLFGVPAGSPPHSASSGGSASPLQGAESDVDLGAPQTPWSDASHAGANPTTTHPSDSGFVQSDALESAGRMGVSVSPVEGLTLAGTLFQTYLLYDLGQELVLIDQHAAHERIRYEKLRRRALSRAPGSSQQLLIPEPVSFPAEERGRLESRLGLLESLGFEAELFSENSLLFRAVPLEWGSFQLGIRLKGLVDRLLQWDDTAPSEEGAPSKTTEAERAATLLDSALFEKLASEACHSAIRAGDRLDPQLAQSITRELFETCEHPWNCPHGRPTVVRVPRARFEEWFQRRV
jgi:DNA mismatch repair protein MutL